MIGQIVHHRRHDYRGVIVDVDPVFWIIPVLDYQFTKETLQ